MMLIADDIYVYIWCQYLAEDEHFSGMKFMATVIISIYAAATLVSATGIICSRILKGIPHRWKLLLHDFKHKVTKPWRVFVVFTLMNCDVFVLTEKPDRDHLTWPDLKLSRLWWVFNVLLSKTACLCFTIWNVIQDEEDPYMSLQRPTSDVYQTISSDCLHHGANCRPTSSDVTVMYINIQGTDGKEADLNPGYAIYEIIKY